MCGFDEAATLMCFKMFKHTNGGHRSVHKGVQGQHSVTFTTGVAGRATVLTEEAELLFGVTGGEAGGITAAFPLLAPLAPLAAPGITQTVNIKLRAKTTT